VDLLFVKGFNDEIKTTFFEAKNWKQNTVKRADDKIKK